MGSSQQDLGRETQLKRHTNLDPHHRPNDYRAIWRWGVTDRLLGRRRVQVAAQDLPQQQREGEGDRRPGDEAEPEEQAGQEDVATLEGRQHIEAGQHHPDDVGGVPHLPQHR